MFNYFSAKRKKESCRRTNRDTRNNNQHLESSSFYLALCFVKIEEKKDDTNQHMHLLENQLI